MRYVTNEQGERVGVLLDLETFDSLTHQSTIDSDYLTGLSRSELQALAESILAPVTQRRVTELLARNSENQLNEAESIELDLLINQADYLTTLKTRAKYTLQKLANLAEAS
jgi:hypothetical protein